VGQGNVARNLVALGARVHLITVTGDDQGRTQAEELLSDLSPDLQFQLLGTLGVKRQKNTLYLWHAPSLTC